MSKSEDYLDGLLDSVGKGNSENAGDKGDIMRSEDDFMKDFEQDMLSGESDDDFLKQFEKELQDGSADSSIADDDMFFENIDGIVNSVKQEMEENPGDFGEDIMVDTLGDIPEIEGVKTEEQAPDDDMASLDALINEVSAGEEPPEENLNGGDQDLMDLLQSEDGLSDIGDMLNADENHEPLADAGFQDFADAEMGELTADGEEAEEKPKKEGFFAKLGKILFGEDEEELEVKKAAEKSAMAQEQMPDIEDLSDENLAILQALDGGGEPEPEAPAEEPEEDEKAKKKAEKKAKKKEEKERKKKEKAEKKANKPKKEKVKKEKKPKEPDNTPPLPKVPVILIFIMAGSFLALVLIATNLTGYSNSFAEAESAYNEGNYELAYQQVSGMEIKEADLESYEKYRIMALVSGEYSAYESLMEGELYDMALDALVRMVGRCDKYRGDAEAYGCAGNMENLRAQAVAALAGFGIGEEEALDLYGTEDRSEYSKGIYGILKTAGLEKVAEE